MVLGTPWLASLGRVTWDFTSMEQLYFHNGRLHTFCVALRRQTPTMVLSLSTPQPMVHDAQTSPPHPPRNVMNRSQRACLPNALDFIDDPNTIIFMHIR
jgi:hypothetical protein